MGHRRRELVDAKAGVYRYDQLIVLRVTRMPAVLLEAGSIVNRQEELQLASPERRTLTSAAIVAAVEDFCAARAKPVEAKAARRATHGDLSLPVNRRLRRRGLAYCRNASAPMIMKLRMLTPSPVAKAGA